MFFWKPIGLFPRHPTVNIMLVQSFSYCAVMNICVQTFNELTAGYSAHDAHVTLFLYISKQQSDLRLNLGGRTLREKLTKKLETMSVRIRSSSL